MIRPRSRQRFPGTVSACVSCHPKPRTSDVRRSDLVRFVGTAALAALCAACTTVPPVQQAFALGQDGAVVRQVLPCSGNDAGARGASPPEALPSPLLRIVSWNLHKNEDPGWDADLARFAEGSDLLLIQEAELNAGLQRVLNDAGYDWLLASAFTLNGHETGVLTAARVRPASACIQRSFEPLLQLPKAAVIARYAMDGIEGTLAVANVHAINFTLGLDEYRAQLEAIAQELANHRGPAIVAGDFNTWSPARLEVVADVMRRINLAPVPLPVDTRSRFLGHQVDYMFVRGLEVVDAAAPEVGSSDHNPIRATLRVTGARP
jgi:endonuclease/exonuclease/phosphatase (EEP) superfamily protein YafD